MSEFGQYLCLGGILAVVVPVVWLILSRNNEEDRKIQEMNIAIWEWRQQNSSAAHRMFNRIQRVGCFITILILPGPFLLIVSVYGVIHEVQEWQTLETLKEKGEIQSVPLLEVNKEGSSNRTSYYVVFQYNNIAHRQNISKTQFERLQDKDSIEIIAYYDSFRISDTEPNYTFIVVLIPSGVFGLLFTGLLGILSLRWRQNSIINRPKNKSKRKRAM